jgi:hypothetical protein
MVEWLEEDCCFKALGSFKGWLADDRSVVRDACPVAGGYTLIVHPSWASFPRPLCYTYSFRSPWPTPPPGDQVYLLKKSREIPAKNGCMYDYMYIVNSGVHY